MAYSTDTVVAAHRHSSNHRVELMDSELCGCFYCGSTFKATDIEEWLEDEEGTALCPHCGIDSVLGSASGYPVHEPEFLQAMFAHWFH